MDFLALKDKVVALSTREQLKIKGGTDTSTCTHSNIIEIDMDSI